MVVEAIDMNGNKIKMHWIQHWVKMLQQQKYVDRNTITAIGDVMPSDIKLRFASNRVRSLGYTDGTSGKGFVLVLGNISSSPCSLEYTVTDEQSGCLFQPTNTMQSKYWHEWIKHVHTPVERADVATKAYFLHAIQNSYCYNWL